LDIILATAPVRLTENEPGIGWAFLERRESNHRPERRWQLYPIRGTNTLSGNLTLAENSGQSGNYNLTGGTLTATNINLKARWGP